MAALLPGETVFVLVFLGVFSLVGTIGNALVIHVYRQKRDKLVSTVFILTLAIVDLSTCLLVIPYTMYMEASLYYMPYDIMCKLYGFLITCNIPFSAFVMVAIAVDRYFCICHPFSHVLTPLRAKVTVLVLGIFACGFGVITALLFGVYQYKTGNSTTVDNMTQINYNNTTYPTAQMVTNYTVREEDAVSNASSSIDMAVMSLTSLQVDNLINMTSLQIGDVISYITTGAPIKGGNTSKPPLVYTAKCAVNYVLLDVNFVAKYQKVYYTMFVLDLLIVVVLYILIYRSVVNRRTKRQRQKSASLALVSMQDDMTLATEDTLCTIQNGVDPDKLNSPSKEVKQPLKAKNKAKRKASKNAKWDRKAMANVRTAAMLFVVTIVFIVTYLPACLMALMVITYSMTIFYLYFFNFIANPLIYAFMNKNFRDDLKRILKLKK